MDSGQWGGLEPGPPKQSSMEPRLGLATTEELMRELICRLEGSQYEAQNSGVRPDVVKKVRTALQLAEILGGMDAQTKEYRTVAE